MTTRHRILVEEPSIDQWVALVNSPDTPDPLRWEGIRAMSRANRDMAWIEYPDQGPDMGAIETVHAFGTCESCEARAHGTTSTDAGIHVCYRCHFKALEGGVIRVVAP